jgi:hypothetical protein
MTTLPILHALFTAALSAAPSGAAAAAPDTSIELRVSVHAAIDAATLDLARRSTTDLLRPAGIRLDWLQCSVGGGACDTADTVVVRVVATGAIDRHVCGGANPESADGGVIMIYVPCLRDVIRTVRAKLVAQSEPRLTTLEVGHLLGLTIAHEIGHVLGLTHAPAGVMQARFDLTDFLDLRMARLAFTSSERVRMRQAIGAIVR